MPGNSTESSSNQPVTYCISGNGQIHKAQTPWFSGAVPKGSTSTSNATFGYKSRPKKRTPEQHAKWVEMIKADLISKGIKLPSDAGGKVPAAPMAVTESLVALAKGSLQLMHAALNNYWPAFPGASAEQTCDAEGDAERESCNVPPPQTWPSVKRFRDIADSMKYTFLQNDALKSRPDQTLKGVVVLIADCHHESPEVQAELAKFKRWGSRFGRAQKKDKLLIEAVAEAAENPPWVAKLFLDWEPRETCIGIESPQLRAKQAVVVTPVMDAITTFVKEMRKAGSEAAQKITNVKQAQQIEDAFNALDKKSQESVRHFKDLAEQADKRHKAESDKISMERDEYFLTEIEKNQGDDQTTYVVLGANHIFRIWNWFASANLPGIVLCREAFLRQFGIPVDEWNDQPPVKSAKG